MLPAHTVTPHHRVLIACSYTNTQGVHWVQSQELRAHRSCFFSHSKRSRCFSAKTMIYNLYIFSRQGKCLYCAEWNIKRSKQLKPDQEKKLMFGLLFSLKSFVNMITPVQLDEIQRENFSCLTSRGYKLHYMESLSGLRFALTTDPGINDCQAVLRHIYELYVEYVLKNGFCTMGEVIDNKLFITQTQQYITSLPYFI